MPTVQRSFTRSGEQEQFDSLTEGELVLRNQRGTEGTMTAEAAASVRVSKRSAEWVATG